MTLLEMAIAEVRKLPQDKQDAIATLIIEELEDERRWDSAFSSSQDKLASSLRKLVLPAGSEFATGRPMNRGSERRRQGSAMNLTVVLEPSDDGGFTAVVPSLPGCISEGDTREAVANVREAVELYLEPADDDGEFNERAELIEVAV